MNITGELWTPDILPPQITPEAKLAVLEQVTGAGISATTGEKIPELQEEQEALALYLDQFGFDLNQRSTEGIWPERALKIGATVAFLAYKESGYTLALDKQTFEMYSMLAELEGIPEAYLTSMHYDFELLDLTLALRASKELETPDRCDGYGQIIGIGAGCRRYYLQQAMAA